MERSSAQEPLPIRGREYDVSIYGLATTSINVASYLKFKGSPEEMAGTSVGVNAALGLGIGIAFGSNKEGGMRPATSRGP